MDAIDRLLKETAKNNLKKGGGTGPSEAEKESGETIINLIGSHGKTYGKLSLSALIAAITAGALLMLGKAAEGKNEDSPF